MRSDCGACEEEHQRVMGKLGQRCEAPGGNIVFAYCSIPLKVKDGVGNVDTGADDKLVGCVKPAQ